jgi:hypothetical protein
MVTLVPIFPAVVTVSAVTASGKLTAACGLCYGYVSIVGGAEGIHHTIGIILEYIEEGEVRSNFYAMHLYVAVIGGIIDKSEHILW